MDNKVELLMEKQLDEVRCIAGVFTIFNIILIIGIWINNFYPKLFSIGYGMIGSILIAYPNLYSEKEIKKVSSTMWGSNTDFSKSLINQRLYVTIGTIMVLSSLVLSSVS